MIISLISFMSTCNQILSCDSKMREGGREGERGRERER